MKVTIVVAAVLQLLCVVAFWVMWGLGKQVGLLPIILSALFLITAIGLLFRKNWARVLTRAFGTIMLIIGGIGLVIASISILRGASEQYARDFLILAIPLVVTAGIGFLWFWAFQASKSRNYFLPNISTATYIQSRSRPLSISVIAILMMSSLLTLPLTIAYVDIQAFPFMGALFEGSSAKLVFIIWGLAYVPFGFGLWYLKEWARIGTFALLGVGFVGQMISVLTGAYDRYSTIVAQQANRTPTSHSGWFAVIGSAVFVGGGIYFLITRRAAFRKEN